MTDRGRRYRGQRLYDRWAAYEGAYRLVDAATRPIRRQAVEALKLPEGATVLDLGCGPGGSFDLLASAVGGDGRALGVDYSEGMTERAHGAAADHGARVLRADAGGLPLRSGSVDGVLASLALSAMPEPRAAVEEVRRVLGDGGRLAVVDGRLPDSVLARPLAWLYERAVDWQGTDVLGLLEAAFPTVEVVRTYDAGLGFLAVAEVD